MLIPSHPEMTRGTCYHDVALCSTTSRQNNMRQERIDKMSTAVSILDLLT
jgi:hypothetical protein